MAEPATTLVFGIKISHIAAGVLGGSVRAMITKSGWANALISGLVGGITAGYLTDWFVKSPVNYLEFPEGAAGFVIGLTAMTLCDGILAASKRWSKSHYTSNAPK